MLYFDFDGYNSTNTKQLAIANLSLSKNITNPIYNKIALSKLNIDFDDAFFCHVPLKENQAVVSGKQNNGYFETIYSIYYYTKISGTVKSGVLPVYYKSIENTDYSSIAFEGNASNRTYDNFNDYFKCKNYNNFLKSLNNAIIEALCDSNYGNLTNTYKPIVPTFFTSGNVLHCNNMSNYQTNAVITQKSTPAEVDATDNAFCLGISSTLGKLLYHPFLYSTITIQGEEFVFIDLNTVASSGTFITINSKDYYITDFLNNDYYEYMSDITEILIHTSMPVATLYKNIKKQSFSLTSQEISSDIPADIMLRLCISHDRETISRLSYSNPSITNNYSEAYPGIGSSNQFRVYVSLVDKYNNIYPLYLLPNRSMYVQLALFNTKE